MMFKSIRTNLFVAFIVLMSLFLACVLMINVFFLDDIFIFGSRKTMEQTASNITESATDGTFLEEIVAEESYRSGLFIAILSRKGLIEYDAGLPRVKTPRPEGLKTRDVTNTPFDELNLTKESRTHLIRFQSDQDSQQIFYTEKEESPRRSVVLIKRLESGGILLLMKPFSPLKESSRLATLFILVSGAVVLLIGSAGVFLISGRITAPILNMDRVARKMANLDFSESVVVSGKDELGALGMSIQTMSENLYTTLNELKDANGKLRLEIDHEREIDQQRRRFISQISHELRTPLSMIQGYADGLRHGVVEEPESVREYCDVIVDETKKMSGLIRDMLDLSSYEAGAFAYSMSKFDLAQMIHKTVTRLETITSGGGTSLEVTGPEVCIVYGDAVRIEQILSNFVNNAKNHGTLGEPISISYGVHEGNMFLEVGNYGQPIATEELSRIWDPFYKAGEGSVSRGAGVGLGLTIVKTIAEAHGGSCIAENSKEGVVFRFVWPEGGLNNG